MIVDVIYGFLGSGKTTFISRILQEWGSKEKIVVLVNEFGDVGIDGTLLQGQNSKIIEMPSGCICCTLQSDFKTQMLDILATIHPERLIIEPTGVATIGQIRAIIELQIFEDVIDTINNILIADATGFMALYQANRYFVESQIVNARLVLLNKCDKVEQRRALLIRDAITAINPDATVLLTEYGGVDWAQYQLAMSTPPSSPPGSFCLPAKLFWKGKNTKQGKSVSEKSRMPWAMNLLASLTTISFSTSLSWKTCLANSRALKWGRLSGRKGYSRLTASGFSWS